MRLARLQTSQLESLIEQLENPERTVQDEIQEELNQLALARLRGEAPELTQGQQELLDTLFASSEAEGIEDITRFAEELAAARGLSVSDSPIGNEALRTFERFRRGLSSAKAGASLDLANAEQIFNENVRQFQSGLEQQAFQNRIALAGAPAPGTSLLSTLTNARLANRRVEGMTRPSTLSSALAVAGTGANVGSTAAGIGALFALSSKEFKEDKRSLDKEEVLDAFNDLDIQRWKYKKDLDPNREDHIGPYAEDFSEAFELGDGVRVNLMDAIGITMVAVQALSEKVDTLIEAVKDNG